MVQYSDNAGHGARLNLLFPPEAEAFWKARVRALRDATGWFIWRVSDAEGQKHWEELAREIRGCRGGDTSRWVSHPSDARAVS